VVVDFGVKSIQNLWPNQHQQNTNGKHRKHPFGYYLTTLGGKWGWGHLLVTPFPRTAHLGSESDLAYNLISSAFASSYLGRNPHPHPTILPHYHPIHLHNPKGMKVQKRTAGHSRWVSGDSSVL